MEKFKNGDDVYLSRKVLFEINTDIREKLHRYIDCPLTFKHYYDDGVLALVTPGLKSFVVSVQYLLTIEEYEAETNILGSIQQEIMSSETKLKENISPPNVEYTFVPKSEVISATVDGKEGFLIKK